MKVIFIDEFPSHFLFSFTSKDPAISTKTYKCKSDSGRVGGAQAVTLGNSCLTTGTEDQIVGRIQHEILHAVGSLHEMNRPDRDDHISIDPRKYRARGLSHRITALNPYYNQVGFGDSYKMTATDKVALNIFLSCPTIKKEIFEEFKGEEFDRNYIELMQLTINPNEKSLR